MGTISVVIAILSIVVLSKAPEAMANSKYPSCERLLNETFVIQEDKDGRRCWDTVYIWGCKGRCLSLTYGHWKFPHKIPNHSVCIHEQRVPMVTTLSNCEEGVAPGTSRYEYIDADTCHCANCDSSTTSCEGARKRGRPSPPVAPETGKTFTDVVARPAETGRTDWFPFIPLLPPSDYP